MTAFIKIYGYIQGAGLTIGSNLGVSVMPKDTSACGQEELQFYWRDTSFSRYFKDLRHTPAQSVCRYEREESEHRKN